MALCLCCCRASDAVKPGVVKLSATERSLVAKSIGANIFAKRYYAESEKIFLSDLKIEVSSNTSATIEVPQLIAFIQKTYDAHIFTVGQIVSLSFLLLL